IFGRMRRLSGIAVRQALFEVRRHADVALLWKFFTLKQIDVPHPGSPPSPRLRRASCFAVWQAAILRSAWREETISLDIWRVQPSFAKASEGILLRGLTGFILRSALARSRMVGEEGLEPS